MNKIFKIILSVLGAADHAMSLLIPIAVSLLLIVFADIQGWKAILLVIIAIMSTLFKSLKIFIKRE